MEFQLTYKHTKHFVFPAGKFAEKAVWRSVFLSKWRCTLNADSTKTHSSSVTLFLCFRERKRGRVRLFEGAFKRNGCLIEAKEILKKKNLGEC